MSGFTRYYIFSSLLFLTNIITDVIFYSVYTACPLSANALSMFMILVIINSVIFFLMNIYGGLVFYFTQKDPDELRAMGLLNKILGIATKLMPIIIKAFHFLKVFLFCIMSILFLVDVTGEVKGLRAPEINPDDYNTTCNFTTIDRDAAKYKEQIIIFYGIEGLSVCFALFCLGTFKSFITDEAFLYVPEAPGSGTCRRLIRYVGP